MAKKHNYKVYKIQSIDDLQQLEDAIRIHGNFSKSDYKRAVIEAQNSTMPSRLQRRLRHDIYPLIMMPGSKCQDDVISKKDAARKEEEDRFFASTYKASDFSLNEGFIEINGWKLKTKRVHRVHPSWLEDIDHEFHIAKEQNKGHQFHFVPYTDLSLLLDAIQEQVNEQEERKIKKAYDTFKESLPIEIDHFINKRLLDNAPKHQGASVRSLYQKLIAFKLLDPKTSLESFDNSLDMCSLRIELSNLTNYVKLHSITGIEKR